MDITLSLGVLLGWETSSEGETISFYFSEGLMLIIEKVYYARVCVMMLMLVMVMVMKQRTRGEKKGDV